MTHMSWYRIGDTHVMVQNRWHTPHGTAWVTHMSWYRTGDTHLMVQNRWHTPHGTAW